MKLNLLFLLIFLSLKQTSFCQKGNVNAWGNNHSFIEGSFRSASIGTNHILLLKKDSTVIGFGNSTIKQYYGNVPLPLVDEQIKVPDNLKGVIDIAAGNSHSVALKSNGKVVQWGSFKGQDITQIADTVQNVIKVAAGDDYTVLLQENGNTVEYWLDMYGHLNTVTNFFTNSNQKAANIVVRDKYCLTITSDGMLYGHSPHNVTGGLSNQPIANCCYVSSASGWSDAIALKQDGTVVAWNNYTSNHSSPLLSSLKNVKKIAASDYRGMALLQNNELVMWDLSSDTLIKVPSKINSLDVESIYTGEFGKAVITQSGEVVFWNSEFNLPYQMEFLQVASCSYANSTIGLKKDSTISTWGEGFDEFSDGLYFTPKPEKELYSITKVAVGFKQFLALRKDGKVFGWGNISQSDVVGLDTLNDIVDIFAGLTSNLAIKKDGTYVRLGFSPPYFSTTDVKAMATGLSHYMILSKSGNVEVIFFTNDYYTFGSLTVPSDVHNITQIAAGAYHALALRDDGKVFAWGGANAYGETDVPNDLTDVVTIAAGGYHSVALRKDGTIVSWGLNTASQCPNSNSDVRYSSIAAGKTYTVAIAKYDSPLGMKDQQSMRSNTSVMLFPNPATHRVQLVDEFKASSQSIIFYNTLGNAVLTVKTDNPENSYDISSLPKGIYYYKIMGINKTYGSKILIE